MNLETDSLIDKAITIWASGGWLMLPLFILTFFIYATALDLFLRVQFHFLVRSKVYDLDSNQIAKRLDQDLSSLRCLLEFQAVNVEQVKRHFMEVRNEYLPPIDRRIRFLAIIITTGPLVGLLGTVTGMLSTFKGMVQQVGTQFDSVVSGISEALITTQTGLVISIPALVLLSLIIQRRNRLVHSVARLERFNTRMVIREDEPVSKAHHFQNRKYRGR
jgi:biopolymer transport protein ExbB